ncbi:E3 ubiquitin-protein ligase TRIM56-like [Saccostrea cucullata]
METVFIPGERRIRMPIKEWQGGDRKEKHLLSTEIEKLSHKIKETSIKRILIPLVITGSGWPAVKILQPFLFYIHLYRGCTLTFCHPDEREFISMMKIIDSFLKGVELKEKEPEAQSDTLLVAQHYIECATCGEYAKLYCNTCHKNVCEKCADAHLKVEEYSDHEIVIYKDRRRQIPLESCRSHPGKNLDLCCFECQRALCSKCATKLDHTGHKFLDLEITYAEKIQNAEKIIADIENNLIPKSEKYISKINRKIARFQRQSVFVRRVMEDDLQNIKRVVEKVYKMKLMELENLEKDLSDELNKEKKLAEGYSDFLSQLLGKYKETIKRKKPSELIILVNSTTIPEIPKSKKEKDVVYTKGKCFTTITNIFGNLSVQASKGTKV